MKFEKDSLVIVICMHVRILNDAEFLNVQSWWHPYYNPIMENIVNLLEYCNSNNIPLEERLYYGRRNPRLNHIQFTYDSQDSLVYSEFEHVYFCGISLDQCVASDYSDLEHGNKTIIKNCSLQEAEYCKIIDYIIKGIPFQQKAEGKLSNLAELHDHVDRFLEVNKIDWVDWEKQSRVEIS